MIRSKTLTVLFAGAAVLGVAGLLWPDRAPAAPVAPTGPALLELFTSQGCSSCPPADRLAATLASRPDLVVIARPVTYWDRLGWKDTLAREANTALQQDYARTGLAGRNGVYTPQMVVNGRFGTVGSNADAIAAGIKAHRRSASAAIRTVKAAGVTTVTLSGSAAGPSELMLMAVTRSVTVGIGSGENGGRKVRYTNVLRSERKLADWQGGSTSVTIRADQLAVKNADAYALVLRQPDGGPVLAARWL